MANSHPGSYCGQDAYNDMFIVRDDYELCASGVRTIQGDRRGIGVKAKGLQGCYGSHSERERESMQETNNKYVRRLTPLETERLQGLPDNWTDIGAWTDSDGKLHKESSDSARYKAVGNSIAVPVFSYVLKRISAQYERPATMGSLFDGIGAFPLIWTRLNGVGSCLWASEIEEFPVAVCKRHFGDEDTGEQGDIRKYL